MTYGVQYVWMKATLKTFENIELTNREPNVSLSKSCIFLQDMPKYYDSQNKILST